jgi:hypothetical protein
MIVHKNEYYDERGTLLFSEPMILSRLWAIGNSLVDDYIHYLVIGRFVLDDVQIVEVRRIPKEGWMK